jgi:hypothetical protein
MHCNVAVFEIHGKIGIQQAVIAEILLDDFALVAKGEDKIPETEAGVNGHDMPQDRAAANFHHRLGFDRSFLPQAGSLAAAQNDSIHLASFISAPVLPDARDKIKESMQIQMARDGMSSLQPADFTGWTEVKIMTILLTVLNFGSLATLCP